MSTLGLICMALGALMIITRAPLIFAPEWERSLIISWLEKPGFIRRFGIFALLLGGGLAALTSGHPEALAGILFVFGVFLVAAAFLMIFFADSGRDLALSVWSGFSTGTLRVLGGLAVLIGLFLVYYGSGL